jgi:hypothetical protein
MSMIESPSVSAERRYVTVLWWSLGLGVGLATMAGLLLWWKYGSLIFVDLLSTLQACF